MATEVVETTDSEVVRIDRVILETIREWAAGSNRTVTGQIRAILQPACMSYLEGKRNGMQELGRDVVAKIGDRT